MRGLARLLRRNPTEAERALWQALVNDRRFAGRGFKRQTPVGQHICDFVSFPLRLVIDLVPAEESAAAARNARAKTRLARSASTTPCWKYLTAMWSLIWQRRSRGSNRPSARAGIVSVLKCCVLS